MITRREILQVGAATAALAAGEGAFTRALAQQRLSEEELLRFDPLGNVTLLHVADIHGQLTPVYFREPSVNIGVGEAQWAAAAHYRQGFSQALWRSGK